MNARKDREHRFVGIWMLLALSQKVRSSSSSY